MARKTFRKVITSKEDINQINPINKKLMQRFLKHKNAKCSNTTITNYESDLNIFFCYNLVNNDNKEFTKIKKIELSEFFDYGLLELQWKGNRYARMRSLLRSFSTFIEDYLDEDYPEFKNLIDKAVPKVPKVSTREKTILMPEEVYHLRDTLLEQDKLQQATYLMLLASSGARVSESLRIDVDMIDENYTAFGDLFLETTKTLKTKGHGKMGVMMTRFLIKDVFLPLYNQWLPIREEILKTHNKEHNKMFIKSNGDPISVSGVQGWVTSWGDIVEKDIYPHCLRHFIVSDLTRKGCSSDFIVAVMKWRTAAMCQLYCDLEDKDRNWKEIDKLKGVFDEDN